MTISHPPVLLLGFNRPELLRGLIDSLRDLAPQTVLVALDGPREGHPTDRERVDRCKQEVERIEWTSDVRTRFLDKNAGLEFAVPAAVTWALEWHDCIAVIEDDVVVGPHFLEFAGSCLDLYRERSDISHVSGYNVVSPVHLSDPGAPARLSLFPESFAWATWRRSWSQYDASMSWASDAGVHELRSILGSTSAAIRWQQIFGDTRNRRIATWAYRWIGSIWASRGLCVSPNQNLISYTGYVDGTHTRRRARWSELPLGVPNTSELDHMIAVDPIADRYVLRQVFRGTAAGVAIGAAESLALEVLRRRKITLTTVAQSFRGRCAR